MTLAARIVGALTALLLAMTLAGSPADAAARQAEKAAQPSVAAKALPKRNLNDRLVQRNGKLFMRGKVSPAYKKRIIVVQRKTCKSCSWKRVARVRTNSKSVFIYQMGAPRRGNWFFRAYAPKFNGYGKSWSNYIYKTYRI